MWNGQVVKNIWLASLTVVLGWRSRLFKSPVTFIQWQFLKMHLQHMFFEEYNVSLGMMNKIRTLWSLCQFSPFCLEHFKFSGAAKLHDSANMKLVWIKDKGKLNRIIYKKSIYHTFYIFVFLWNPVPFCKFYLWAKDIFTFYFQRPQ